MKKLGEGLGLMIMVLFIYGAVCFLAYEPPLEAPMPDTYLQQVAAEELRVDRIRRELWLSRKWF